MTRNFHRWEVDPFFCAAEEVQDSADRLESVYRTWLHARSVADDIREIEFQKRELSTALGTAKWQLEEFEKAVSSVTLDDCDQAGDDAPSRHKQFVDALQSQISTIERALSSSEECKDLKPHQVLQLGEKEKDDLARFLCGSRSIENNVGECTTFKVGKAEEVVRCFRVPLENKDGAPSHFSMSAPVDFQTPALDTCLWRGDTSSSDKQSRDLIDAEIRSFSGTRIDEISKPVSDPTPEYFHSDRGEPCPERVDGHHRSISVGSGLNAWKNGSVTDGKRKRQRFLSADVPSDRLNFWAVFGKVCYPRRSNSGLKRWKDGDANERDCEMLALIQDAHDIEQRNGVSCLGTKKMHFYCNEFGDFPNGDIKHQTTSLDSLQIRQSMHFILPFGRLVPVASAILVALGLVGFLSFHVSSSSL